jgi:hypothetical protein
MEVVYRQILGRCNFKVLIVKSVLTQRLSAALHDTRHQAYGKHS